MQPCYINLLEPPVTESWQICPMTLYQQSRSCVTRNAFHPDLVRAFSSLTIKTVKSKLERISQVLSLLFVLKYSKLQLPTRTTPSVPPPRQIYRDEFAADGAICWGGATLYKRRYSTEESVWPAHLTQFCRFHWLRTDNSRFRRRSLDEGAVNQNWRQREIYLRRYFCMRHLLLIVSEHRSSFKVCQNFPFFIKYLKHAVQHQSMILQLLLILLYY